MDLELAAKVVIVTGGTDGLGAELCRRLVAEGARVALCGRKEDRVESMAAELSGGPGEALSLVADVASPSDIEALVSETVDRWGRVDGLVNNAGRSAAADLESISDEEWQEDFDLKVMAAVRLIRACVPHMRPSGGSVVNILAIAAKAPKAQSLPSAASRATGLAITKALSKELGPSGIRVNAVLNGFLESGQWHRRAESTGTPLSEIYDEMSKGIPLGRVGKGEEFADVVTYLLSERSSYVTGSAINLDGGLSPAI